eukprot:806990-Rhodomonas_salina.2
MFQALSCKGDGKLHFTEGGIAYAWGPDDSPFQPLIDFNNALCSANPRIPRWTPPKQKPAHRMVGALSKLVSNSPDAFGLEYTTPRRSNEQAKQLMLYIMRQKFAQKEFRDALLATGDKLLVEKPRAANFGTWTAYVQYRVGEDGKQETVRSFEGGNLCGQCLMQIRREIRKSLE